MKNCIMIDAAPDGRHPRQTFEIELIGTVPKEGEVEYRFDGGYNNVVEYFRAAAEAGKIKIAFTVFRPQAATALYRLFTLAGRQVPKARVVSKRQDGSEYAALEFADVKIASVSTATVTNGTIYLLALQAAPGKGTVKH